MSAGQENGIMAISQETIQSIAGIMGSVSAMALTYPLLTITTRQQVLEGHSSFAIITSIIKQEGWKQLYSGLNTSLVATALSMGIFTFTYERFKRIILISQKRSNLSTLENLIVGYLAGAVNTSLTTPFWVIVTRLQANKQLKDGPKQSFKEVIMKIWNDSKFAGFFKGWRASIVLCLNPAFQWMVYEQLTLILKRFLSTDKLTSIQIFVLGAIAKIVATLITYPYIVIKSRMQASNSHISNDQSKNTRSSSDNNGRIDYQYTGIMDAFVKIIEEEGFVGLYRGLNSKILQSVLNSAFMFLFKEQFVSLSVSLLLLLAKRKQLSNV